MTASDTTQNPNRIEAAGGRYRPDIDGLRAVAVVPVVLYHYGIAPFTGGYVGVDIFFVISGFLITRLIHAEIKAGHFSIVSFYERRVRRIFPALFAVLIVATALAAWLLFPDDLKHYAASLFGTSVFGSNFIFWSEAGYFDAAASQKPLLHTWSLAVEEQFYLLFPALLFLLRKARRNVLLATVVALFVASLAANIWAVNAAPVSDFYLLPFRIWELMLGAFLALAGLPVASRMVREFWAFAGAALIAWSVFVFTADTPFPGAAALLPCAGAALLIYSGTGATTLVNGVLGRPLPVGIGLISYSLYLWHWPLLVFARYARLGPLPAWETAALIALSAALAFLSWRYVEKPFRGARSVISRKTLFPLAGAAMVVSIALGVAGNYSTGLPQRFSPELQKILALADERDLMHSKCFSVPMSKMRAGFLCHIGDPKAAPSFLLWGDSHAGVMEPVVSQIMAAQGRGGDYLSRNTCPPLLGVSVSGSKLCRHHNNIMLKAALKPQIKEVILSAHWARYSEMYVFGNVEAHAVHISDRLTQGDSVAANRAVFARGLERTVAALAKAHKRIVIIASVPEIGWRVPETWARIVADRSTLDIRPTLAQHLARQAFVFAAFERMKRKYGVTIVYPDKVLCRGGHCMVEKDGLPIYRDHHHLTVAGAMLLRPLLAKAL